MCGHSALPIAHRRVRDVNGTLAARKNARVYRMCEKPVAGRRFFRHDKRQSRSSFRGLRVLNRVLKRSVQGLAGQLGYRIVPRNRDAMTLRRFLERLPIRTVIDVGANDGTTSGQWLATFPQAKVHSVEALERYRQQLDRRARASGARMTVWPFAASDSESEVVFYEHADHPSSSSLLHSTEKSHELLPFTRNERAVTVQARRLDTLFAENQVELEPEVLIKLDVQGAELKVLSGCTGFLDKVKAIIVEVNLTEVYEGQPSFSQLIGFLEEHDLNFIGVLEQFHAGDDSAVYLDAVFLRH